MTTPFINRLITNCLTIAAGCTFFAAAATAQTQYPTGPVTLVVNLAAGGPLDLIARMVAEHATEKLGQPVIVENKTGAAGNVGAQYAARQKPDGHTLLFALDTLTTVNPHLYTDLDFDAQDHFKPVSMTGMFNQVLIATPELGVSNFEEFAAQAQAGELMYGSAGIGAPGHLTMEMLKQGGNYDLTHVPYQGNAPAVAALLSGEVDTGFLITAGALPHIRAEKLVPLAVSGTERDSALPDVPTIAEMGLPGLEDFDVQFGMLLMAPADTPDDVVEQWTEIIADSFNDETIRERLENMNIVPDYGQPEEAQSFLTEKRAHWKEVIDKAGIKTQ